MDAVFDRVLCATDLSRGCSEVFKDLALVRESGLIKKMRMLYVVPPEVKERRQAAKEDALGDLAKIKKDLEALGISVETNVREGVVPREITKEASEWGASVIIISRVDKGVIEDIVTAGVSIEVVRESSIPVLIEKHSEDARGHVLKAPLWPMGKVLVPVDISDFPGEAAEFLRPLAGVVVHEVVLAHVVEAGTSREVQRDFEMAAEGALADYAGEFESEGLKTTVHVHRGEAPSGIIEIAVEEKAGMIIMPSRGRRVKIGMEKTWGRVGGREADMEGKAVGSVAEEMLKHSPTPVMFLPQPYQSALRAA